MSKTFEKEISWQTWELGKDDVMQEVTKKKVVTFNELDKYDKSQHEFHFEIAAIPNNLIDKKNDFIIEPAFILAMTIRFVDVLAVVDEKFTPNDKRELFQNSQSMFDLGKSLLDEKIIPFFLKFRRLSN